METVFYVLISCHCMWPNESGFCLLIGSLCDIPACIEHEAGRGQLSGWLTGGALTKMTSLLPRRLRCRVNESWSYLCWALWEMKMRRQRRMIWWAAAATYHTVIHFLPLLPHVFTLIHINIDIHLGSEHSSLDIYLPLCWQRRRQLSGGHAHWKHTKCIPPCHVKCQLTPGRRQEVLSNVYVFYWFISIMIKRT